MNPFRTHHLVAIFTLFETHKGPLDLFLSHYFRTHKSVGAQDRRWISETVYGMVRMRGLIDHLATKPVSWESRLQVYLNLSDYPLDRVPPHIRVSFPKQLFELLTTAYPEEQALEICRVSNTQAPLTLRANELKTDREALLALWKGVYGAQACHLSPTGIHLEKRANFFAMDEFKEGLFEVQDEASQLVANLLEPKEGDQILDFCAGAGGKTLAFAPQTRGGQIYLHDIRPRALEEAKKRLRRAGVQNCQLLHYDDPKKKRLRGKMDWVFVDVPCTGSGTLRRNPDMKWKFNKEALPNLIEEQRRIFEEALSFLKQKGTIIYATCSLLPQENQEQTAYFQEKFSLSLVKEPFQSIPTERGMDGFFGAVLKRI